MDLLRHLTISLLAAALTSTSATAETLGSSDMQVHVSTDTSYPGEPYYVSGSILIDAPRETVWGLITDCDATEQIVPQLQHCEVQVQGDGWDHRSHDVRSGPFRIRSTFRSDYVPLKSIAISRVSGDMEVQEGTWTLASRDDGRTELSYEAWSKPKIWVPRWFIARTIRKDAPRILTNLKTLAEAHAG
ncbi:MAG: SRPBCC family protein [Pseudomonadota bacterium]